MRHRLFLGLVVAAIAAAAMADSQRFTTAAIPHIALVEPRNGAVLRGGETATITWSATRAFDAEEWEAFLSVDGGRYYSARITPHLEIGIRTFTFVVPNVETNDARLMIRTGDERDETAVELPQRFSIRATAMTDDHLPHARESAAEAARPGDEPVVQWSAGPRSGIGSEIAHSTECRTRIAHLASETECDVSAALPNASDFIATHALTASPVVPYAGPSGAVVVPIARDVLPLLRRLNI